MGLVSSFGASLGQPDEVGCYRDAIVGSVTLFTDRDIVDYCTRAKSFVWSIVTTSRL
jgi:hypothetical protein